MSETSAGGGSQARDKRLVIEARGLGLAYGASPVLEAVDLDVARGEFWCLIGPNATGKTSFLKAVLGVLKPRAGSLWVAPEHASRRRVGFVPQHSGLSRTLPMTVREVVCMGLTGTGAGRADARANVAWALARVGLSSVEQQDYWSLSGGQRQRALVARALARRPALLILDEPTNGLDLAAEEQLLELVAELQRSEGLTILFVTHAIQLAARFATHVALFFEGGVIAGERDAVLNGENLRRAYQVEVEISRGVDQQPAVRVGLPPPSRPTPDRRSA